MMILLKAKCDILFSCHFENCRFQYMMEEGIIARRKHFEGCHNCTGSQHHTHHINCNTFDFIVFSWQSWRKYMTDNKNNNIRIPTLPESNDHDCYINDSVAPQRITSDLGTFLQ